MGGTHSFGFIKPQEGEKDLYFPGDVFKRCYGKEAVEGDIVQFQCIKKGDKEMVHFCHENEEDSPWILVTRSNRDEKRVIRCPHKSFVVLSIFRNPLNRRFISFMSKTMKIVWYALES